MRTFDTGATRDVDENKYDYEGFLSPLVVERFAAYMHKHRLQADGKLRDSDNWQKGMPLVVYMKSGWRHFFEWWREHRAGNTGDVLQEAICALMFNLQGYLHTVLTKPKGKLSRANHAEGTSCCSKLSPKRNGVSVLGCERPSGHTGDHAAWRNYESNEFYEGGRWSQ